MRSRCVAMCVCVCVGRSGVHSARRVAVPFGCRLRAARVLSCSASDEEREPEAVEPLPVPVVADVEFVAVECVASSCDAPVSSDSRRSFTPSLNSAL